MRYVMKFRKEGYVKYTSHLDMMRTFKRCFKKTGLALRYSQGFNPHPKMSFAQPLSLGYSSQCELIEFETEEDFTPREVLQRMQAALPEGLEPISCTRFEENVKSLAAEADSAVYAALIPIPAGDKQKWTAEMTEEKISAYLAQTEIFAMKRQKKTKKLAQTEIRKMIRGLNGIILPVSEEQNALMLNMHLDCGSTSNLSPELVLTTFCQFADLHVPRHEIEVDRKMIYFVKNLQF